VIYMFNGPPTDGANLESGLILDAAGNLFGTTQDRGAFGYGIVFELTENSGAWQETVLHNFGQGSDGQSPDTQLIMDASGNLYGTTPQGGENFDGTAFEITP
jgi:hypothetical protein